MYLKKMFPLQTRVNQKNENLTRTYTETLLLFTSNVCSTHSIVIHLYAGNSSAELASITRFTSDHYGIVSSKAKTESTNLALDDGKTI